MAHKIVNFLVLKNTNDQSPILDDEQRRSARLFRYMSVLCTGLMVFTSACHALSLQLFTEDSPPYNYMDHGEFHGISVDKIKSALDQLQISYQIKQLPWARALLETQRTPNSCLFSTSKTPDRLNAFKWIGPISYNLWVLYSRNDFSGNLLTLEDARPYTIGTYNADARDFYLKSHGFKVDTAAHDEQNPAKLVAKRIDLWATSPFKAQRLLREQSLVGSLVPKLTFNKEDLYLACHLQLPDQMLQRIQAMLLQDAAKGIHRKIDASYQLPPVPTHLTLNK